ncbi:MAG: hypothetical protein ACI3W9_04715 [Eubacteriales bacterium]
MRIRVISLFASALLLLSSCKAQSGETEVKELLSAPAIVFSYAGTEYVFDNTSGVFTVKSGSYADITVCISGDSAHITVGGLEADTAAETFPSLAAFSAMCTAFAGCEANDIGVTDDGSYVLASADMRFLVTYYSEAGTAVCTVETELGIFEYTSVIPKKQTFKTAEAR